MPTSSGTPTPTAASVPFTPTSPPFPAAPPAQPLTAQQMGIYLMTLLNHRPTTEIHVGPMDPALSASEQIGTPLRPFAELQQAIDYGASRPETQFAIVCAPGTYADVTIPAGKSFYVECKGKVTLTNLTIVGGSGGAGQPNIFDSGLNVTTVTFQSALLADSGALALKGFANIGSVVSTGLGSNVIVGAGLLEAVSQLPPVTFMGAVDVGSSGFVVAYNCDIQGAVTAGFYSSVDTKERCLITTAGTLITIHETEDGFPYGAPVVTFTGSPGVLKMDTASALAFYEASGSVVNGTVDAFAVGPKAALYNSQPYAFGAGIQYPALLVNNGVFAPAMENAQADAFLQVVPTGPRLLTFLEVQIDTELLAGEDFTVELVGCVYDPSGNTLLHDQALSPFDTPITASFVAGDKASLRVSDWQSLKIGGVQATHITYRWVLVGASIYQGLISVEMGFSP